MAISQISTKYQIVIPKEIRKKLALKPGQRFQVSEKEGCIELRPILSPDQLVGFLSDCGHIPFERDKTDRELS